MTVIEQLKAEIEKRLKNTRDYMNGAGMKYKGPKYHASRGRESAYDAILSFLSTLESEKPINQDGLDEEIERYLHSLGVGYGGWVDGMDDEDLRGIARHFAKWGAEHFRDLTKKMGDSSEIPKDLLDAQVEIVEKLIGENNNDGANAANPFACEYVVELLQKAVSAGAKWDREQMMEEAVEVIVENWSPEPHPEITIPLNPEEYSNGDKVRVIIVKED